MNTNAICTAVLLGLSSAACGDYTFINIVDSTGSFQGGSAGFRDPSINDAGTVVFWGALENGTNGLFTGNGGAITPVVDDSGTFKSFTVTPTINASGAIAFRATHDDNALHGIYVAQDGRLITIATTDAGYTGVGDFPAINDSGLVVFNGTKVNGVIGLYVGSGGSSNVLYDTSMPPFSSFSTPTINNSGVVAFTAGLFPNPQKLFKGSGGPTTTIADPAGQFASLGSPASINDAGVVAFWGVLDGAGWAIATGSGRSEPGVIASSDGPFINQLNTSIDINNSGAIAFYSGVDSGGSGIFTGPDPVADKVIKTGDSLFGVTVSFIGFARGLNNHGDIAFRYILNNSVAGIAVAKASVVAVPGDIDGDGDVDAADLGQLLGAWGTNNPGADLNDDGVVDASDLGILLGNWTG